MNNIIEQMIKVAAEGGPITPRQKALILNKARELGEDIDLVEIALENTNVQKVSDNLSDKRSTYNGNDAVLPGMWICIRNGKCRTT